MLAASLDTLLFLLLMAGVGLIRLLLRKANGETIDDEPAPPPPRTARPLPRAPNQTDEERIRKFLEALGQPTTSAPPPPVSPRPLPPLITESQRRKMEEAARAARRRIITPRLPPLTTVPPPLPRRVEMPAEMTTPPKEPRIFKPVPPSPEVYEVQETTAVQTPPAQPVTTAAEAYTAVTQKAIARAPAAQSSLIDLIRSADGLRQAVLLREILGPPRSLQSLENS